MNYAGNSSNFLSTLLIPAQPLFRLTSTKCCEIEEVNLFFTLWSRHTVAVTFIFADISPDRKGDGGESIYGPTFEGKKHVNSPRHLQYYTENLLCMCVY